MNLSVKSVPRKSPNVVSRKIAGECILVPLAGAVADVRAIYCLNETGATVWELIDGCRSVGEIVAETLAEYDAEDAAVERDVTVFVTELLASKLLEA